jgi:glutathione S-transferase
MLDDGRVLSESGAILFYFARDTALFPADAWGQATVLRWIFFEQYSHEPHIAVNRHWELHLSPTEHERLAQRIADNHRRGNHALDVMEQQFGGNDFLAAGRYTIADIALYAYTHTAAEGGFDLQPYRGIRRWLERVHAQPGYIPQMQEEPGVLVVRWPG